MHTNRNQDISSDFKSEIDDKIGSLTEEFRQEEQYVYDEDNNIILTNDSIYNSIKMDNPKATKRDIILVAEKA